MNKAMLIEALANAADLSKSDSKNVLEALINIITTTLKKGDEVAITGFGTFEVVKRKARKGVNPATRKPMSIPASNHPKFKAGKALKDAVKK